MTKLLFAAVLLALLIVFSIPTMAQVNINVSFGSPPPIVFEAPPDVIVMPDTNYVYVVPDIDADIFFWNGWWWRPWEGRWYRSRYYNRSWAYYNNVPRFYFDIDPGWRGYYRDRNWYGHQWHYERIPNRQLQQNWKTWQSNQYWERQRTWGVQSYQPRPQPERQELRQQRQQQYQQRPEVQQHQQLMQKQPKHVQQPRQQPQEKVQKQPKHVQQPRQKPQEKVQKPQKQEQRPEVQETQHSQPQEKPERGKGEHKK